MTEPATPQPNPETLTLDDVTDQQLAERCARPGWAENLTDEALMTAHLCALTRQAVNLLGRLVETIAPSDCAPADEANAWLPLSMEEAEDDRSGAPTGTETS